MKKLLGLFVLAMAGLGTCSVSHAWTQRQPFPVQNCQVHAPYGFPQAGNVTALCQQAYLVGYDPAAKLPKVVT